MLLPMPPQLQQSRRAPEALPDGMGGGPAEQQQDHRVHSSISRSPPSAATIHRSAHSLPNQTPVSIAVQCMDPHAMP